MRPEIVMVDGMGVGWGGGGEVGDPLVRYEIKLSHHKMPALREAGQA